ncbi:hypothetical protein BKA70DRAFT_1442690 [Coprinopsis sp. MPI-PUGE-AT-0042]|nr:hypothetical protein BKA70DRAFT_1442690 [Coprinopsis sp. MPI-PUGE-AT-0042]
MSPRSALQLALLLILSFQLSFALAKPTFPNMGLARRVPTETGEYQTNAQRLAAGLSPMAPKRRFSPSKVGLAARAAASPISYSGTIAIRDNSGTASMGWMASGLASGNIVYTSSPSGKLPVSFTYYDSGSVFEIGVQDTANYRYVGVAGSTLGSNNANAFNLVRTNSVPYGPPQTVGHSASSGPQGSESFIWKLNPTSNELTAVWVNPSGNVITPTYFYVSGPSGSNIRLSGHGNLNAALLTKVRLFWEP